MISITKDISLRGFSTVVLILFAVIFAVRTYFISLDLTAISDNSLGPTAISEKIARLELECKSDSDHIQKNGGWCLEEPEGMWIDAWGTKDEHLGRPANHHAPPDKAIGETIIKYLGQGFSLIDIGAGVGQYGYWFQNNAPTIKWNGYDGAGNVESWTRGFVKWTDATDKNYDNIEHQADWVMSLEVGEHVPSKSTFDFIDTLNRHSKKGVILSWAVPGQGGHGHINEKTNDEVISLLKLRGYYQDNFTAAFQSEAREKAMHPWFKQTVMVFMKSPRLRN